MNILDFNRAISIANMIKGELCPEQWLVDEVHQHLVDGNIAEAAEAIFAFWCTAPEWGFEIAIHTRLPEGVCEAEFAAELRDRGIYLVREYEVEWLTYSCVILSRKVKAISEKEAIRILLREESDINPEASAWPRVVAA